MGVDRIKFKVQDTGVGIKEEDLPKLFKIFGKIQETKDINPNGIGLGLAICNKILKEMNSKLEVKSREKKGTTFYFEVFIPYLPLKKKS